jgi:hypothetical protein
MKIRGPNVLVLLLLVLSSACAPLTSQSRGTDDSAIIATVVAQTMAAQKTLAAGRTAVTLPTDIATVPTDTPVSTVRTQLPSTTPLPSPTQTTQPSTPTPAAAACDWAQFVGDVTVADGSLFAPGGVFNKTWRLKNIGTCTWTSAYALVFVSGATLGTLAVTSLPHDVKPGDTLDLTIRLTAPAVPGSYQGNWMLRNAAGTLFGVGEGAVQAISTQIQVIPDVIGSESAYDFTANFCSADWLGETGALTCPGISGDANAYVTLLNQPVLESGKTYDLAILTHPNNDLNGWISGRFPYYQVADGDRFMAEIGCLAASQGCDVNFHLEYRTSSGDMVNLGTWRETYDGQTTTLNINLSGLAGQDVQFVTSVTNNGRPGSANAFWHQARIQNVPRSSSPVLIWNRDPGDGETCDELRVYLNDEDTGSAQAINCLDGHQELGWSSLSDDEVAQFQEWVSGLKTFDAQVYHGPSSQGGTSWINFHGSGDADPRDGHIRAMDDLAGNLFAEINDLGFNSPQN